MHFDKQTQTWHLGSKVPTVKFIKNWNNKLNCEYFTSIRRHEIEANIGDPVNALLSGAEPFPAKIISCKKVMLQKLTDFATYVDAGLNKAQFTEVMQKMYPNSDVSKGFLYMYLFKRMDLNLFDSSENNGGSNDTPK